MGVVEEEGVAAEGVEGVENDLLLLLLLPLIDEEAKLAVRDGILSYIGK